MFSGCFYGPERVVQSFSVIFLTTIFVLCKKAALEDILSSLWPCVYVRKGIGLDFIFPSTCVESIFTVALQTLACSIITSWRLVRVNKVWGAHIQHRNENSIRLG